MKNIILDADDLNINNDFEVDNEILILNNLLKDNEIINISKSVKIKEKKTYNDKIIDHFFKNYKFNDINIYIHVTYKNILDALYLYYIYRGSNKITFFGNYLNYISDFVIEKYDDINILKLNYQKLFDCNQLLYHNKNKNISINTFNGCPYVCEYCALNIPYKSYDNYDVDYFTLNKLIGEYDIESVFFTNELFFKNVKDVKEFVKYKNNLNYEYSCSMRTDVLNRNVIDMLCKSKCRSIFLGIESGSIKIQNYYNKVIDKSQLYNNVNYLLNSKINTICSFIISDPRETEDDLNETLKLIWELKKIERTNNYEALIIFEINKIQFFPETELTKKFYDILLLDSHKIEENYSKNKDVYSILQNKKLLSNYYNIKKNIDGTIDNLIVLIDYFFNTYMYIDKSVLYRDYLVSNGKFLKFLQYILKENSLQLKYLIYLHKSFVYGYEQKKFKIFSSLLYKFLSL
ncbi:radical SAM protein [Anaerococcus sp. AGMB09787]|uniref:B12-binding domain-containing radical SAM protein n=1 Tax=Anaerococcus sp. AGMB09787 TaxID=2922869 RepID=UPI001FAEC17D|nr:radical SAM protein [Anaerococcus sp. AGMB09787]